MLPGDWIATNWDVLQTTSALAAGAVGTATVVGVATAVGVATLAVVAANDSGDGGSHNTSTTTSTTR